VPSGADPPARTPAVTPTRTWPLAAGIGAAALLAYAFQLIGGRLLGPTGFAPISVLWTMLFLMVTVVLVPVEQFVARESTTGRRAVTRRSGTIAAVGGGATVAAVVFVLATRATLFEDDPLFAVQAGLMVAVMLPVLVARGLYSGHRRFSRYGTSLLLEGIGKLAIGLGGIALIGGASGLAWGLALGPLLALGVPFLGLERRATTGRSGSDGRFLGPYIGAGMASQTLLAGAPLAVAAFGGSAATISIVFVTFTSFRTPVSLIYPLQGRLLYALVRLRLSGGQERVRLLLRRTVAAGLVAVLVAGPIGAVLGPPIVVLLFGAAFEPSTWLAGLAAVGVVAAMTSQVVGQGLVAEGRTGTLARRWVVGLATALVVTIAVPVAADLRVAIGFAAGELTTLATMVLGVLRDRGAGRASA